MVPDMCYIIKYTTLLDGNYTDLRSYSTFRYCPYTWAVQLIRGVFHLGISLSYCLGLSRSSVLCGVFTAEEVDRVRDKGSGDTTTFTYRHTRRPFENIPEICLFY